MRSFLLIIASLAFLLPSVAFAITGDSSAFYFSNGQPATVDNTTSTCSGTATVYYGFSGGMSAPMLDTTATCTSASVATPNPLVQVYSFWW